MAPPTLFTLPPEIRDVIWMYALQDPFYDPHGRPTHLSAAEANGILVQPSKLDFWETIEPYWGLEPMTRLLRVNHQIHDEATAVLYSKHTFFFGADLDCGILEDFLNCLNQRARELIKVVTLTVNIGHRSLRRLFQHMDYDAPLRKLNDGLPGLKVVRFGLSVHFSSGSAFWEDLDKEHRDSAFLPDPKELMGIFRGRAKVEAFVMPEYTLRPEAKGRLQSWCHRMSREVNEGVPN